jgi:hypothetical protein
VDPDVFFQETGKPSNRLIAICQGCPVLIRCTFDALKRNDSGYQAGMSKMQRDRIRTWDKQQKLRAKQRTP